jgi:lipopolysaccharide transport system ATP-binding protein
MNHTAIAVEGLSKRYQIGALAPGYRTFREAITDTLAAPLRRCRSVRTSEVDQRTIWALNDVSFGVQPGEVIGIVGRNGAGKSTLLKILSQITEPTAGRVEIRGRVASLLEVGTGFHPELTGRENVYLNGGILGMTRREINRNLDEIVAFAELEKFIDTPVKRYSSGMYLRLAFAVAAHLEPEILVIDEILAVGDQEFQNRCIGRMQSVSTSGRTVLFVSHNVAAVSSLCTRALLLAGGKLAMAGSVAEVLTAYQKASSSSSVDWHDLSAVPRRGTGTAKITAFRILDRHGNSTDRLPLGEPARFELSFRCRQPIRTPAFGIAFNTLDGRRVLRVETSEMVGALPFCEQGGTVACQLGDLMLTPGAYIVALAIGDGGKELIDYVEQWIKFEVLPVDVYGTGRLPSQASSAYVTRGHWKCSYQ